MKVNIQVQYETKPLDQCYRARAVRLILFSSANPSRLCASASGNQSTFVGGGYRIASYPPSIPFFEYTTCHKWLRLAVKVPAAVSKKYRHMR